MTESVGGVTRVRALATALIVSAGLAGLSALLAAGSASAASSGCVQAGTTVIVPARATCTLAQGTSVAGDVIVLQGATLIDDGANIALDVRAYRPAGIGIQGGTIGRDLVINGLSGQGPRAGGDSYVCAVTVGRDLRVQNGTSGAGTLVIGDAPDCTGGDSNLVIPPGNSIGRNLVVRNNADPVAVSNSTVTGNMLVLHNTAGTTVADNSAGKDAVCQGNAVPRNGGGNTAANVNLGCPVTGITGMLEATCNAGAGTELRSVEGAGFLPNTPMTFTITVDGLPVAGDLSGLSTDASGAFDSANSSSGLLGFTLPLGKEVAVQITATDGVTTSTYDRSVLALCSS